MDNHLYSLFFSATDTTAKIVKEVARGIGNTIKDYNITMAENRRKGLTFKEDDLLIVGVPVYSGRVPNFLSDYFARVKGHNTRAVFIVVYGNRDYDDALLELKDIFEANGFIGIAAGAFIGEHSYSSLVATGRPDAQDLQAALGLGAKIKVQLEQTPDSIQTNRLVVKGNFPYKEIKAMPPMAPETSDDCIECGICAEYCPMEVIDFDNFKDIEASGCIRCCSCIKRCPVGAKSFQDKSLLKVTHFLIDNFRLVRKEPEMFLK